MMVPDLPLICKSRLQELAQRKNWSSPIYSHVREGPSHNPRFKATVTVEGKSFESPEFFSTLREAEHSAAKVAFASFPDEGISEEKSVPFKNLLQELAQKKGLLLPVYTTIKSGASHFPTFQSTVQIDDEIFSGKAATAKKEAEANAAKVAWITLKEHRDGVSISMDDGLEKGISGLEPGEEAAVSSSFAADMYTYLQHFFGDSSFTEASKLSKSPSGQSELYTTSSSSIPRLNNEEQKGAGAVCIGSTGISKQRNKVVVFPRWGNVKLPEGVMEEFSDKKWVAVTRTGSDHGSK